MNVDDKGSAGVASNQFEAEVRAEAAAILGLADAARLGLEDRLPEAGLDSLMSLDLRNRLARKWGRILPPTLVAEFPTVAAIARHFAEPQGLPAVGDRLQSSLERLACSADVEAFNEVVPLLNRLASAYALQAFSGVWSPGEEMTVASGATRLRVVRQHHLLFGRLLELLAEDGFLQRTDAGWRVVRDIVPEGDVEVESARLLARFPVARPELTLLQKCGGELAPALRGEANPLLSLLVGGGWTILEDLYAESPPLRVLNTLAGLALESAAPSAADGVLRVLEVGAGTGGTTRHLLPRLDAASTDYELTDESSLFLSRTAERFNPFPFVRCRRLDLDKDPFEQGFDRHRFDVVIAAHVLHATRDLRATLTRLSELLVPGGLLVVAELTKSQRWLDLTFGLTEGWWRFEDGRRHPLASIETWLELLSPECGFAEAVSIPRATDAERFLASSGALFLARALR